MAPPARRTISLFTTGPLVRALFGWLGLAFGIYFLAGWIGSSIPRNADWRAPSQGIEIIVESNGVHTAIVMPLITPQKDWREEFRLADVAVPAAPYTHVSVSWGEREVYLNTPNWADLSPMAVLRILTVGGKGLLHVAFYVRPSPDEDHRVLRISPADYSRLIEAIEARLPPKGSRRYPGYDTYDVFYDAAGDYTAINTCNQWTSNVLADAGIRTGWWTPFAGGVMKWVPKPISPRRSLPAFNPPP